MKLKLNNNETLIKASELKIGNVFTYQNRKYIYIVENVNPLGGFKLYNKTNDSRRPSFDEIKGDYQLNQLVILLQ